MARPKSKKTKKDEYDLRKRFGARVRELRNRRGYSLEALGERSGVDDKYLQAIETARHAATVDIVQKLAAGLGVQPVELFTFDGAATSPRDRIARVLAVVGEDDLLRIAGVLEALARV
jgi:transcriptional regulator with XRE-family HTH domain